MKQRYAAKQHITFGSDMVALTKGFRLTEKAGVSASGRAGYHVELAHLPSGCVLEAGHIYTAIGGVETLVGEYSSMWDGFVYKEYASILAGRK